MFSNQERSAQEMMLYHVPGLKTWSGKQLFLGVYVTSKKRRERGARAKYRVPR